MQRFSMSLSTLWLFLVAAGPALAGATTGGSIDRRPVPAGTYTPGQTVVAVAQGSTSAGVTAGVLDTWYYYTIVGGLPNDGIGDPGPNVSVSAWADGGGPVNLTSTVQIAPRDSTLLTWEHVRPEPYTSSVAGQCYTYCRFNGADGPGVHDPYNVVYSQYLVRAMGGGGPAGGGDLPGVVGDGETS